MGPGVSCATSITLSSLAPYIRWDLALGGLVVPSWYAEIRVLIKLRRGGPWTTQIKSYLHQNLGTSKTLSVWRYSIRQMIDVLKYLGTKTR